MGKVNSVLQFQGRGVRLHEVHADVARLTEDTRDLEHVLRLSRVVQARAASSQSGLLQEASPLLPDAPAEIVAEIDRMKDAIVHLPDAMTTDPGTTIIAAAVAMSAVIVRMKTTAEGTVAATVDIADLVTATIPRVDMAVGDQIEDTTDAAPAPAPENEDAEVVRLPDLALHPVNGNVAEAAACLVEEALPVTSVPVFNLLAALL